MNGFQTNGELSPTENAVRAALDERKKSGLYRTLTLISSPQKKRVKVGNRKLLLFSSNSYLNLTCDPLIRLKTAAARPFRYRRKPFSRETVPSAQ